MCCDELLRLIEKGARVMQKESVLFARKNQLSFEVKSTFDAGKGTLVIPFQTSSKEAEILK